jgi:predicted DsbA family dithiol-disulfide isomerase
MPCNVKTPRLSPHLAAGSGWAALLACWTVTAACAPAQSENTTAEQSDTGSAQVLAMVDGEPVTISDLPDQVQTRLKAMEFQYLSERHQLLDAAVQSVLTRRLLQEQADAEGIALSELVASKTDGNISVSDDDVAAWYRRNRSRLGGRSLEELSDDIRRLLVDTERSRIVDSYVADLERRKEIVRLLDAPRADLNNGNAASLGPKNAPVTIVEFSDFECPYCRLYMETLYQIRDEYGKDVRIVYRHYPLPIHPNAPKAAEASLCAEEQGKFWQLHDLMFNEQRRLGVADLKEKASRLQLDRAAFDDCLDSGRYEERVMQDVTEGESFGVEGTPATFINGVPISSGALPYESLAEAIDKELRRLDRD